MKDEWIQAFAHLNVHDRLLQIVFATWLSQMTKEEATQQCADIIGASRSVDLPADAKIDAAEAHGLQIVQDATSLLERFLMKAQKTADALRVQSPPR